MYLGINKNLFDALGTELQVTKNRKHLSILFYYKLTYNHIWKYHEKGQCNSGIYQARMFLVKSGKYRDNFTGTSL